MIVYGDPAFMARLPPLIASLRRQAAAIAALGPHEAADDHWRTLLITSGQTAQAMLDEWKVEREKWKGEEGRKEDEWQREEGKNEWKGEERDDGRKENERHTGDAGGAVVRLLDAAAAGLLDHERPKALAAVGAALDELAALGDVGRELRVKVPEGFAFYGLFPEQYAAAARQWLVDHRAAEPKRAVVVGLRSIGTTLGAVVAHVLRREGWQVQWLTVRPTGEPFAREVTLASPIMIDGWALIVDEGPGLSGSSMAAAGMALERAGLARSRIAFLPGHTGEPGSAASDLVRDWWQMTPRYVGSAATVGYAGDALMDQLARSTTALLHAADPVVRVLDVGWGQWRGLTIPDQAAWPAVALPFELPKYLCETRSGRRVLWKWGGLASTSAHLHSGAEAMAERLTVQAATGITVPALGTLSGYVAQPWRAGVPLTCGTIQPADLALAGRYLAQVAAVPLAAPEHTAAVDRLLTLLYWNSWELHGEPLALRLRSWFVAEVVPQLDAAAPTAGDGRVALHEWLRLADGSLCKTDSAGHQFDHTAVGPQAVAWDLAGLLIEWQLDQAASDQVLAAFVATGGSAPEAVVLCGYGIAYAAFRAGQLAFCADQTTDPAERDRLLTAKEHFAALLTLSDSLNRQAPDG